jgi:lipid-A-disaccharide synthase
LSVRILLSCGEASGDLYAGALTRSLRAIDPSVEVAGLGGPQFAAAGGRLIDDYRNIAVSGFIEWIPKLPRLLEARRRLVAAARTERPDALVLIDFSGFNLRMAPQVKALGVPVIYYISPQVWASRAGRIATIKRITDRMLVIFPFEQALYEQAGVPVEFVGHPLVDLTTVSSAREPFLSGLGLSPSAPTVALLPGSRPGEVSRMLPDLLAAVQQIRREVPAVQCVIARAPHLPDQLFAVAREAEKSAPFRLVEGHTDDILAASDLALMASGTATVQGALHDTPMVIVYRLSAPTYRLARRLVKLDTIGMVNLIAGEKIAPELVQEAFTPEAVAREATSILTDRQRAAAIRTGLARVRERLGGSGASHRAAEAILRVAARSRDRRA